MKTLFFAMFMGCTAMAFCCHICTKQICADSHMYEEALNHYRSIPDTEDTNIEYIKGILDGLDIAQEIIQQNH